MNRSIDFENLRDFCRKAYEATGVPSDEAFIVADLLARADLRGVESHGVTRLPIYILRLQKKYVRAKCRLTTVREKGPTLFLEAHGSMGHLVSFKSMHLAIEKAREFGLGWVSVKDSGHFGVAGLLPLLAAEQDLVGYICSNSAPMMAPFGGRERILGNNPLAYAFPAHEFPPLVVDFSCSVVSSGRLILSRKRNESIPLGWAYDPEGVPTTDPYDGYEGGGSLTPMGEHKGYGLGLAHEILTALLTGGKWTRDIRSLYQEEPSGIQGTCHSFMALDPDCFVGREELKRSIDDYIISIKESAKAKNTEKIWVPGERSHAIAAGRLQEGIPVAENTARELDELARSLGLSVQWQEA